MMNTAPCIQGRISHDLGTAIETATNGKLRAGDSVTEATIIAELRLMREAFKTLCNQMGARLTRTQLCERMGIHRNTLATYMRERRFPQPGKDNKWLLSEVIEWESQHLDS